MRGGAGAAVAPKRDLHSYYNGRQRLSSAAMATVTMAGGGRGGVGASGAVRRDVATGGRNRGAERPLARSVSRGVVGVGAEQQRLSVCVATRKLQARSNSTHSGGGGCTSTSTTCTRTWARRGWVSLCRRPAGPTSAGCGILVVVVLNLEGSPLPLGSQVNENQPLLLACCCCTSTIPML